MYEFVRFEKNLFDCLNDLIFNLLNIIGHIIIIKSHYFVETIYPIKIPLYSSYLYYLLNNIIMQCPFLKMYSLLIS